MGANKRQNGTENICTLESNRIVPGVLITSSLAVVFFDFPCSYSPSFSPSFLPSMLCPQELQLLGELRKTTEEETILKLAIDRDVKITYVTKIVEQLVRAPSYLEQPSYPSRTVHVQPGPFEGFPSCNASSRPPPSSPSSPLPPSTSTSS
jgi:hypothetical protein